MKKVRAIFPMVLTSLVTSLSVLGQETAPVVSFLGSVSEMNGATVTALEIKEEGQYRFVNVTVDQSTDPALNCDSNTLRLPYDNAASDYDDGSTSSHFYSALLVAQSTGYLVDFTINQACTDLARTICIPECIINTIKVTKQ